MLPSMRLLRSNVDYVALNQQLAPLPLTDFLRWSLVTFGERLVQVTSFGPTGIVILDHLAKISTNVQIATIDTGFLFPETYAQWEAIERRYGVSIRVIQPELTPPEQERLLGPSLWELEPDVCCHERKVKPMAAAVADQHAWITGVRRDQSGARAQTPLVAWDTRYGLFKLSPLANWSKDDVWNYIRAHDLPYNELHDRGYSSIGCMHCTRLPANAADERSGRWQGRMKTECGLHLPARPFAACVG
jgi:phosphoadenosine phosphosulfate reductase